MTPNTTTIEILNIYKVTTHLMIAAYEGDP